MLSSAVKMPPRHKHHRHHHAKQYKAFSKQKSAQKPPQFIWTRWKLACLAMAVVVAVVVLLVTLNYTCCGDIFNPGSTDNNNLVVSVNTASSTGAVAPSSSSSSVPNVPVPSSSSATQSVNLQADVLVYGQSSGAVTAAYAAAKTNSNLNVVYVSQYVHAGGMSSSGLSVTDIGVASTIGGYAATFYSRVGAAYGSSSPVYSFEPHVAENVFNGFFSEVAGGVTLFTGYTLQSVVVTNNQIQSVTFLSATGVPLVVIASYFIDATYEGDLMASSGVPFVTAREGVSTYTESLAGVLATSPTTANIYCDPWNIVNDTTSGLLYGLDSPALTVVPTVGASDVHIQIPSFRFCLTTNVSNMVRFTAPPTYNVNDYELVRRFIIADSLTTFTQQFTLGAMPFSKFDANEGSLVGNGFFFNNLVLQWIQATYSGRASILTTLVNYMKGMLYYLQTNTSLPSTMRSTTAAYGYCADEFTDNQNFPWQLYVREARRMVGQYVMTQHDTDQDYTRPFVSDAVAQGSYSIDTHFAHSFALPMSGGNGLWNVRFEGDLGVIPLENGPYPISFSSLVPAAGSITNLVVPVAVSASHVAYANIRMEPVYMMLGHAAGTAAALAIGQGGVAMQNLNRTVLQTTLLSQGALFPTSQINPPTTSPQGIALNTRNAAGSWHYIVFVPNTSLCLQGNFGVPTANLALSLGPCVVGATNMLWRATVTPLANAWQLMNATSLTIGVTTPCSAGSAVLQSNGAQQPYAYKSPQRQFQKGSACTSGVSCIASLDNTTVTVQLCNTALASQQFWLGTFTGVATPKPNAYH